MRGHILKRSKNSYAIVLYIGRDPDTGKPRQRWLTVRGSRREAERRLTELLHEMDHGKVVSSGNITLGQFLRRWLRQYVWPNLAPMTAEGYNSNIRAHILPKLGDIKLTQLKPEQIQQFYAQQLASGRSDGTGGLSPRSVRHHHAILHMALDCAVKWGLLSVNPVSAVSPPRCRQAAWRVVSESEIWVILEAAKSTPFYAIFYLALFTGMRRSELLPLRWSDIDLVNGQVSVTRSLQQRPNGEIVIGPPKSEKARRLIDLTPLNVDALKQHRKNQAAICHLLGIELAPDHLVFCRPGGEPVLPNTLTQEWIKLVRGIGLGGVRFHDCRHSHASILLKGGVHPKVVQERLGHASIQVTLDTYSHVVPGLQEAAARRFDELVCPAGRGPKSGQN